MADWVHFLAPRVRGAVAPALGRLGDRPGARIEEVRLRVGRPLHLVLDGSDGFLTAAGQLAADAAEGLPVSDEDVQRTFQLMAQGSVYAWEEELRGGFLTLPGGHRVGLAGRVIVDGGRVQTLRPVTALNLRIARAVPGAALPLVPHLAGPGGQLASVLLISPPRAGKTTVLRDLVRLAATGAPGLAPHRVAVVDERSELAGAAAGVPRLDLGPRTDVLAGCPKAQGMLLALRALSPQVLAVDEIGGAADAAAVLDGLLAGVAVLATAHAGDLDEAARRPALRRLLAAGAFGRAVVLSRRLGPATAEQVFELPAARPRLPRPLPLCPASPRSHLPLPTSHLAGGV